MQGEKLIMELREISKEELKSILEQHALWLENPSKGACANLRYANLRYANLRYANLRSANLYSANLRSANLRSANLRSANLYSANLRSTVVSIFEFQKHRAICAGERLTIGCEDLPLAQWAAEYEEIGRKHGYSEFEIMMYGKFIEMCIEAAGQ